MKFNIVTLGCPKNEVDSEGMEVLLKQAGHCPVDDFSEADLIVVNTCGFIDAAKKEALAVLREVATKKRADSFLIAAGCLAQREGEALVRQVAGINAVVGCRNWTDITKAVELLLRQGTGDRRCHTRHTGRNAESTLCPVEHTVPDDVTGSDLLCNPRPNGTTRSDEKELCGSQPERGTRADCIGDRDGGVIARDDNAVSRSIGQRVGVPVLVDDDLQLGYVIRRPKTATAYIKISDGCDASCTFCIIPSIKGSYKSKPVDQVLSEARSLVESGVQEIILIGQDTTAYGLDRGERDGLATLLRRLSDTVPNLPWLRVLYLYPQRITPALIEAMAELPQLCRYVDIPLQHTHPAMLRRMGRPQDDVPALVARLRESIPDVAIRTTFIVGFPGETEREHRHLLHTIESCDFDRVGVFTFSPQKGTKAASIPGQISENVKQRRRGEVMEVAQRVSLRRNRQMVGRVLKVLVEGMEDRSNGQQTVVGRSYRDAPEVDGLVFFRGEAELGKLVDVRITSALEYDLIGDLLTLA